MAKKQPNTVVMSDVLPDMKAEILYRAGLVVRKLLQNPQTEKDGKHIKKHIKKERYMTILMGTHLSGTAFSDCVWRNSVRDAYDLAGHRVDRDDCAHHDTIECTRKREYKAARIIALSGGKRGIWVTNADAGLTRDLKVDILVADGDSIETCRIISVSGQVLQKYVTPYKGGWQLHADEKLLAELSRRGLVTNLAGYLEKRTAQCLCSGEYS